MRSEQRLVKRGRIYHAWIYLPDGTRIQRTTGMRDKANAEKRAQQLQAEALDPAGASARQATVGEILTDFVEQVAELATAKKRSAATVEFYRKRAGTLLRCFEYDGADANGAHRPFLASALDAARMDEFVSQRRGEGVSEHTIYKDLVTLRSAFRLAIRRGKWVGRIEKVFPVRFSAAYEPRKRNLSVSEVRLLLAQLAPDEAARVAFIVATSACWHETELARREDIKQGGRMVLIRGTKRKTRFREVPIVLPEARAMLSYCLARALGEGGLLFQPWPSHRRTIRKACKRAGIERCSPNDLRRTFGSWHRAAGVSVDRIAKMMGHNDSRMLETVYGQISTAQLAARVAVDVGLEAEDDCFTAAVHSPDLGGFNGLDGQLDLFNHAVSKEVPDK